jgi:hypothetical protein
VGENDGLIGMLKPPYPVRWFRELGEFCIQSTDHIGSRAQSHLA